MNDTAALSPEIVEIVRQWNALAPKSFRFAGTNYKLAARPLFDNATTTVRFDYCHKARGAFLSSKVVFSVSYDAGADLYRIAAEHFDGTTFASTYLALTEGATFEAFARPDLLARPETVEA